MPKEASEWEILEASRREAKGIINIWLEIEPGKTDLKQFTVPFLCNLAVLFV